VLLGDALGDGDEGTLEFELSAGSQAAANSVNRIVGTSSARLMDFVFELLIRFCLVRTRLKSRRMLLERGFTSNGCSHRSSTGISPLAELKPSFSKECLHDLRTRNRSWMDQLPSVEASIGPLRIFAACRPDVRWWLCPTVKRLKLFGAAPGNRA